MNTPSELDPQPKEKLPPEVYDKEERLFRYMAKLAFIILLVFFASLTTCTMHSNTYDADRLVEETKLRAIENLTLRIENAQETERLKTLEQLVRDGADPISVRCAIMGWNSARAKEVCKMVAIVGGRNTALRDPQ